MKKLLICIALTLAIFLAGCQNNPATEPSEQSNTQSSSNTSVAESLLSKSIEIHSLDEWKKMREMASCDNDTQLEQFLQTIADSGIQSKDELVAFVELIDTLPHFSILDGDIAWLCFSHSISQDTGKEATVVYVTRESADGDWTRVEYVLSVDDVAAKISEEKASTGESSLLSSSVQSADGRLTLHIETRNPHPSGEGTTILWTGEADGIFVRIYYYANYADGVNTDELFQSLEISNLS